MTALALFPSLLALDLFERLPFRDLSKRWGLLLLGFSGWLLLLYRPAGRASPGPGGLSKNSLTVFKPYAASRAASKAPSSSAMSKTSRCGVTFRCLLAQEPLALPHPPPRGAGPLSPPLLGPSQAPCPPPIFLGAPYSSPPPKGCVTFYPRNPSLSFGPLTPSNISGTRPRLKIPELDGSSSRPVGRPALSLSLAFPITSAT
jgi:hypothetical protein